MTHIYFQKMLKKIKLNWWVIGNENANVDKVRIQDVRTEYVLRKEYYLKEVSG